MIVNRQEKSLLSLMQIRLLAQAARGPFSDTSVSEELLARGYRLETDPLYCLLQELEQGEFLLSAVKVVNGRRARVYEITSLGKRALRNARREVEKLHYELHETLYGNSGRKIDSIRVKR